MKKKMKQSVGAVILAMVFILSVFNIYGAEVTAFGQEPNATEQQKVYSVDDLFSLNGLYKRNDGWKSYCSSSYDLEGGNLDGEFFYMSNYIRYTRKILDVRGPGVITNFWWAGYAQDMAQNTFRIICDGIVLYDGIYSDFFAGSTAPFLKPYVGIGEDSGGGCFCYVPILFNKSCVIEGEYFNYYKINYTLLPKDYRVEATTVTEEAVVPSFMKSEERTIETMTSGNVTSSEIHLGNGLNTVYEAEGDGIVEGLTIGVEGLSDNFLNMPLSWNGYALAKGQDMTFSLYINPDNCGVYLKWRTLALYPNQTFSVFIDGVYVADMSSGQQNLLHKVKDVTLFIPEQFTARKTYLNVRLLAGNSGGIDNLIGNVWAYSKIGEATLLTDSVDFDNADSEAAHSFNMEKANWVGTQNADLSDPTFSVDLKNIEQIQTISEFNSEEKMGAWSNSICSFTAKVSGKGSVVLTRRTSHCSERLMVYVDDKLVGAWNTLEEEVEAVRESAFVIPTTYLDGKASITVSLRAIGSATASAFGIYENSMLMDYVVCSEDDAHSVTGLQYSDISRFCGVNTLPEEWATTKEKITKAPDLTDLLSNCFLRVTYGNESFAAVDISFDRFFAVGIFEHNITNGLTQGLSEDGILYCYLPIPYDNGVKIEIIYKGTAVYDAEICLSVSDLPEEDKEGLLKLRTQTSSYDPVVPGKPLNWLTAEGSGKLIGLQQNIAGSSTYNFLEGDEIIVCDGNPSMTVHGTGTEDIYCGAWYFTDGMFSCDYIGCTYIGSYEGTGRVSAYRFYVLDQYNFRDGIEATIEHGPNNDTVTDITDVTAFYYQNETPSIQEVQTVTAEEAEQTEGIVSDFDCYGRLEGNYLYDFVAESARRYESGGSVYRIQIPLSNQGLLLRRLFAMDNPIQAAMVYVDGEYVGVWYNGFIRSHADIVRYDDFIIPGSFTEGKTQIMLEFRVAEGYVWDESKYQIFTVDIADREEVFVINSAQEISGDYIHAYSNKKVEGLSVYLRASSLSDSNIAKAAEIAGDFCRAAYFDVEIVGNGSSAVFRFELQTTVENVRAVLMFSGNSISIIPAWILDGRLIFYTSVGGSFIVLAEGAK